MAIYYFAKFCKFLVGKLPTSIRYLLACIIGDILYVIWLRGRKSFIANVKAVLGDQANSKVITRIARQAMRNFCKYCIDFLRSYDSQLRVSQETVTIHGLENIDLALKEGKGAILVSFHLGNWDLGIRTLSRLGYPLSVIVETLKSKHLDKFVMKLRANLGVRIITTKEKICKMVEVLRRNELLALLIDHNNHNSGVEVRFGSCSALMPAGAATLALRTGAKVIPCWLVRSPNNTFHGFIGEPIRFHPSGNLANDIRQLTQHVITVLEQVVKQFPDQWYMFRRLTC